MDKADVLFLSHEQRMLVCFTPVQTFMKKRGITKPNHSHVGENAAVTLGSRLSKSPRRGAMMARKGKIFQVKVL